MKESILLLRLHVGVDGLYVVEIFQFLHHLVDDFALLGSYFLQVIGDIGKLTTYLFKTLGFQSLLDFTITGGFAIYSDCGLVLFFVVLLIVLLLYSEVNHLQNEVIHIHISALLEGEDTLVVEEE